REHAAYLPVPNTTLFRSARAANRYRGEIEPMDPVAGHIPGALNRPSTLNVQADGRFKPAAELRHDFNELLQGQPADRIVHQCGSDRKRTRLNSSHVKISY